MAVRTGAPGIDPSLAHRAGCGCHCVSGCEYSVRMRTILNVGLLFGGESPEHEVSIVPARAIAEHLDAAPFTQRPMGIARTGVWVLTGDPFARLAAGELPELGEHPFLPLEKGAEATPLPDLF